MATHRTKDDSAGTGRHSASDLRRRDSRQSADQGAKRDPRGLPREEREATKQATPLKTQQPAR